MAKKPTVDDARLILELYDLKREAGNAQGAAVVVGRVLAQ